MKTYVPGFWSLKGWKETVWTDMVDEVDDGGGKKRASPSKGGAAVIC